MKQAMLAVSFGTTHADAEAACIRPVETALAAAFPDWTVFRAWTSRIIVRRLRERGIEVESDAEALARLQSEDWTRIAVVSTHIIPGQEYDRLKAAVAPIKVSEPLLANDGDLRWMAGLLDGIAAQVDGTLLVMGHGTEHRANETYARLRDMLTGRVRLACVEGELGLNGILDNLDRLSDSHLTLMPLMLVAGDHAKNDLAGNDGDSWKSILMARGFDVGLKLEGLGSMPEVRQRIVEKARAII